MTKFLLIAGHGPQNVGFDPGAIGFPGGEYNYMKNKLFPAMKKYANGDFIFHVAYNVYDRGNLVALARSYGSDVVVIEFHYDAGASAASGGHVIIHEAFGPDSVDLRLRDAIKDMLGTRYNHKGHEGISGRGNLGNVNRAKSGNVNYRLLELGFGTNKKDSDVLLNKTDELAKKLVEAILNKAASAKPSTPSAPVPSTPSKPSQHKPVLKSNATIAQEVMAGKWGNDPERTNKLKAAGYNPSSIQSEVNKLASKPSTPSKPALKSNSAIAKEVMAGQWGNDPARTSKLKAAGYNPSSVQAEVNKLAGGHSAPKPSLKSNTTVAKEVLAGKWGNNPQREQKLKAAGYNPQAVQSEVNKLAGAASKPSLKSVSTVAKEVIDGKWGNNPQREQKLKAAGYNPQAVQKEVNRLL